MKLQIITDDIYHDGEDLTANGRHMIEAVGNISADVAGYPHHYAAVTVSEQTATTVRINPGRLYVNGKVYDLDEPFDDIDLQPRLPRVVGDTVWVAILLRGLVKVDTAIQVELVDADTEETDTPTIPVRERYTIEGIVQAGLPGPTPLKPDVAATECIVAWVLLGNTSIENIEMHPDHRVKSLYEVEGRLSILEVNFEELKQVVATLRTDLSAVAAAQRDAVRKDVFEQVLLDVSGMRRMLRVFENEPRAYVYDPALVRDKWDTVHSEWMARIEEGIRFPFAYYKDEQLALDKPADPRIRVIENLLLPAYSEVVKLSVAGGTGSKNISQLQHTVINAIKRTVARSAVKLGPIVTVCENIKDWANVGEAARTKSRLSVNGETFQVVGLSSNKQVAAWNADPQSAGHKGYDVQKLSVSTWTETYWDYVTEEVGLNGSVYGQTWLNSQAMIMTAIRLRFTRVGTAGDVHLVVCECREDGSPDITKVIGSTTVEQKDLTVGKVRFPLRAMLIDPGKRYAWFTVTTGNHAIAFVADNKFAEGSSFQITDGLWAQGSNTEDFEFDILGAKFESTRTVVDFNPLILADGISYLRLIAAGWAPDGTQAVWEFQREDETAWWPMTPDAADVLYGLPSHLRLRLVMVGTTDLAPAIIVDNKARGEFGRTRGDMRAITNVLFFGVSTTAVTVDLMIDQWIEAEHMVAVSLIAGGVTYTPTATSIWQDPDRPKRRRLSAKFTSLPNINSARVKIEGMKSGVDEWFGESLFVMVN